LQQRTAPSQINRLLRPYMMDEIRIAKRIHSGVTDAWMNSFR
jgi:hypothetical protein